jgi:hypothetical protein
VQMVNVSELHYHRLFEKFHKEILLSDAETVVIPDDNLNGLLMFSKLNETPAEDFAIPTVTQHMNSEDILFLFKFDPVLAERPEEIDLPGIDQLPAIKDDQAKGILNRENVTNLIHTLAKLHIQDRKSKPTEKR